MTFDGRVLAGSLLGGYRVVNPGESAIAQFRIKVGQPV